jgi:hypothetical protein
MGRVFTAIERAALPKQVVYSDFAAPAAEFGSSTTLDPECFYKTALLACEGEILEFPPELRPKA